MCVCVCGGEGGGEGPDFIVATCNAENVSRSKNSVFSFFLFFYLQKESIWNGVDKEERRVLFWTLDSIFQTCE